MIILQIFLIYLAVASHCLIANVEVFIKKYSSSYVKFFGAFLSFPFIVFLRKYLLINDYIFKL